MISLFRSSLLLLTASIANASLQIVPGATWTATNTGKHVQAHGAGVIKLDDTFYLIGEDKTNGSAFQNINCYSSKDLVSWTYEGALLSRTAEAGDLGPNRVVERPKVLRHPTTGKYVLYMHIDSSDYGEAKVGVAVGDTVCGKYTYLSSWRPLGFQSRDMGLFQDDDGKAYLMTEDRANGLRIDALTDDYLNISGTSSTYLWDESIEAPAILKRGGYYFMFGSWLTGWSPNDNVYSYATNLSGPWSSWDTFADVGSNTYSSQTNYILPLSSSEAIYLGDRWISTNLMRSTYIWLPLTITNETNVTMPNRDSWVPHAAEGAWSAAPAETSIEAENATLSGGARILSCSGCSGASSVGYLGGANGTSGGTVTFDGAESDVDALTTLRLQYENGDTGQRFASVSCNGVEQTVAFLPTTNGNTPGSSVVNCQLKKGSGNEVVVEGLGDGTWGPDLDELIVPSS